MGDYIDRDAFIDDVKTEIINLSMDGLKGTRMPHDELYGFIERIKSQPAADVAPVVHGRWEIKEIGYGHKAAKCSNCGMYSSENVQTFHEQGADFTAYDPILTRFCPNCGAKMDKEANDE